MGLHGPGDGDATTVVVATDCGVVVGTGVVVLVVVGTGVVVPVAVGTGVVVRVAGGPGVSAEQ